MILAISFCHWNSLVIFQFYQIRIILGAFLHDIQLKKKIKYDSYNFSRAFGKTGVCRQKRKIGLENSSGSYISIQKCVSGDSKQLWCLDTSFLAYFSRFSYLSSVATFLHWKSMFYIKEKFTQMAPKVVKSQKIVQKGNSRGLRATFFWI